MHVLPTKPTEEPQQPILLVNDEDINDVTFTGIQQLKPDDNSSMNTNDEFEDTSEKNDARSATRKTKLIISGNMKMRRLIVFTNSNKFQLRRRVIRTIRPPNNTKHEKIEN